LGPTVIFIAVYTVALEISSATTAYDPINYRLVSPLYVPTIVLVLSFVQKLAEPMERLFSKKDITRSLIVLSVILLLPALASNIGISRLRITQGAGMYNTDRWQHSEIVLYLRSHALDSHYPVYSNSADALYILTTVDARMSPAKTAYNSPVRLNTLSDLDGSWPEVPTAYLVWFDNSGRDFLFTFDELEAIVDVQSCGHFSDGTICLVSRRN
jgi:hypothetical protein